MVAEFRLCSVDIIMPPPTKEIDKVGVYVTCFCISIGMVATEALREDL